MLIDERDVFLSRGSETRFEFGPNGTAEQERTKKLETETERERGRGGKRKTEKDNGGTHHGGGSVPPLGDPPLRRSLPVL